MTHRMSAQNREETIVLGKQHMRVSHYTHTPTTRVHMTHNMTHTQASGRYLRHVHLFNARPFAEWHALKVSGFAFGALT